MKNLLCFLLYIFTIEASSAQTPGEWTWVNGANYVDYFGSFGPLGVASPISKPTGTYESSEWTDKDGNFWIYGGTTIYGFLDDLWKYDPTLNLWTWVKGSRAKPGKFPTYGTKGVPSLSNSPGMRSTSATWTDKNGDLWLYGGFGAYDGTGGAIPYKDLWRYSISSNMWTWMKGDTSVPFFYGKIGEEIAAKTPPDLAEMGLTWCDKSNNLWMMDANGCMWKYRIATNNWIWMKGDSTGQINYGRKGITTATTTPGKTYFAYTRWTDYNDDLWYLYSGEGSMDQSVLFKYNISTNMWTWVWGDTVSKYDKDDIKYGDTLCDYTFDKKTDENVIPFSRVETRTCWVDNCNNLWMMGGAGLTRKRPEGETLNDMVYFDPQIKKWIWVGNDTFQNYTGNYGILGVSSPTNKPTSRSGALPFKDKMGNLWLYGGLYYVWPDMKYYSDLWKFTMDKGCPPCYNPDGYINVNINDITYSQAEITISPNPFSSSCHVVLKRYLTNVSIILFDIRGRRVMELNDLKGTTFVINRGQLTDGIYFLKLLVNEKLIANKKLMIN